MMRVDGNHGATLHYEPNSYNVWNEQPEHNEPVQRLMETSKGGTSAKTTTTTTNSQVNCSD